MKRVNRRLAWFALLGPRCQYLGKVSGAWCSHSGRAHHGMVPPSLGAQGSHQVWMGVDVSDAVSFMATRGQHQPTFPSFLKQRAPGRDGRRGGDSSVGAGWGSVRCECTCLFWCLSGLGPPSV